MRRLDVPVLVTAGWIGRLRLQVVVFHQGAVLGGKLLRVTVLVNRQRHAIGAMALGHSSQSPQGVLQARAQADEVLTKAQRNVFPVRKGQHEVISQMGQGHTGDRHRQFVHGGEIRSAQPARLMNLGEEYFLGHAEMGFPAPHPSFEGSARRLRALPRLVLLQPLPKRFGLQTRLFIQLFRDGRPHFRERIGPRPPSVRLACFLRQKAIVPVLAGRLPVHVGSHRRCP